MRIVTRNPPPCAVWDLPVLLMALSADWWRRNAAWVRGQLGRQSPKFATIALLAAIGSLVGVAQTAHVGSVTSFPQTPVGTPSAPLAVTFTFDSSGSIAAPAVLTQGATGLDFADAGGGSCTTGGSTLVYSSGQTCTVNVIFSPKVPGLRSGAVQLTNSSGAVVGTATINGVGTGPYIIFDSPAALTIVASIPSKYDVLLRGVASDAKGDVFFGDNTNGVIREVVASNGTVTSASPVVMVGSGLTDPEGIAIDGAGDIVVIDNNAVKEIVGVNGVLSASSQVISLTSGYSQLVGVALDGAGNVYFTDAGTGTIYEMTAVNGLVTPSSTVSPIFANNLSITLGIRVDSAGNIFLINADPGFGTPVGSLVEILANNGVVSPLSTIRDIGSASFDVAIDAADDAYLDPYNDGYIQNLNLLVQPSSLFSAGSSVPFALQHSGLAYDPNGYLYELEATSDNHLVLLKGDLRTPPTLTFPLTPVGSTSTQLLFMQNAGNAPLIYEPPASGSNPILPAGFTLSTDRNVIGDPPALTVQACPQITAGGSTVTVASGGLCYDYVTFQATGPAGILAGQIVTTNDDQNAVAPGYAMQAIPLVASIGDSASIIVNPVSVPQGTTSTTLTAVVTFTGPAPAGPLTFTVDGNSVGTGTCASSSSTTETCTLTYNPSALTVGAHALLAATAADANYLQTTSTITNNLSVTQVAVASTTQGMTAFPDTPFGSTSTPLTITFTFQSSGTMAMPQVLTTGASGLDFTDAGTGTCTTNGTAHVYAAGNTCTVNVLFQPTAVGHRSGAVLLSASGQNPASVANLVGNGTGPWLLYTSNATPITIASLGNGNGVSSSSTAYGMVIDGRDDLLFSDNLDNTVKMIAATNGVISPGTPITTLLSGFVSPAAMAMDGAGNLYVVDSGAAVVEEFVATNGVLSSNSPMVVLEDQFPYVLGLAVDDGGNVFFTAYSSSSGYALYELAASNGTTVPNTTPTMIASGIGYANNIRVDGAENLYLISGLSATRYTATNGSVQPGASTFVYPTSDYFGNTSTTDAAIMPSGDLFLVGNYDFYHFDSELGTGGENEAMVTGEAINSVVSDSHGRLYANTGQTIQEFDFSTAPALTFTATQVGSTTPAQTFIVQNEGNSELDLNDTSAGLIGVTSSGFTATSTVCYGATVLTSPQYVPAQVGCLMSIAFSPVSGQDGTLNGTYTMTDNSLNVTGATQTISLVGSASSASDPAPTVMSFTPVSNYAGQPSTFNVSITSSTSGMITGTVTISENGVALSGGSGSLTGGSVRLTSSSLSAGTHNITATFIPSTGSPFASASATAAVTITGNPATIYLSSNTSFVYDGTQHPVTATTVPANLSYTVTYDDSPTVPTAVGSYRIVATINDPFYAGTAAGTLTISQTAPTATVTLGNLSATYNGTAHTVTATTTPAGLTVYFTVGGLGNYSPGNAGYYAVTAEVTTPGYTGSATGELIIAPAQATVTLGNLTQAYTGSPLYPSYTTVPAYQDCSLTFNGSATVPTGPGTYTVVATVAETNYTGSATGIFTITGGTAATVTLGNLNQTYTGSPLAATATTSPAGLNVSLTYNGSATAPTAAGSYAVAATVTTSGYTGSASGTLIIVKAPATITLGSLSVIYTGTPLQATAATAPPGLAVSLTYNGSPSPPTNAGSYAVAASVTDPNYTGATTGTLTIAKASATVSLGGLLQAYTGSSISITATTTPVGLGISLTYSGSSTPPTAVGNYAVVATVTDPNYAGTATGTLAITGTTPATVTLSNLTQTYSGLSLGVGVATSPAGLSVTTTYNGAAPPPVSAGSYAVLASVTSTGYSGTATGTLVVRQAATATLIGVSAPVVGPGQSAVLTATVSTIATGTPSGSVNFFDGTTLLGSAVLSNGVASYTTSALMTGTSHAFTATYSGDNNFLGSTTNTAVAVTVAPLDFTLASSGTSSQTVVPGGAATYTFQVAPLYGSYAGVLIFSVTGLPSGATATISPTTIPANSGPQVVTVRIQTAAQLAASQGNSFFWLALLVVPLTAVRRRRTPLRRLCILLIAFGGLCGAFAVVGCGASGNGFFGQAQQSYSINVTATANNLQHTATVSLNVE